MPNVLIREIPTEDLEALDAQARQLGLSRADFLRRHLHQQAQRVEREVTAEDLHSMSALLADLADENVMREAWS